ncbi:MAG: diacylglycerol kinase family protein [Acidobacteriota bacterium]
MLCNPTAGHGRAGRRILRAMRRLEEGGAAVELRVSDSPGHLVQLGREAADDGVDRLVVCGGDGTLNLVLRELDLVRSRIGIIPMGSGDDFAQALGIPRDVEPACEVLIRDHIREIDVALANGVRYLGVAGVGFDSEVARHANEVRLFRGSFVYLYAILKVLPRFRPHRAVITIDGQRRDEEMMFTVVGNSMRYGGGIVIAPGAELDDGLLDLCIVRRCTRWDLLRTLPLAYSGAHVKRDYVEMLRGRSFEIDSDEPLDVYADGERLTSSPVSITIAEQRLKVVAP